MSERIKHSYQSVWMARWTQTTCNVEESDTSRSSKEFKEIETRSFGIVNDSLALGFTNLRNGEYPEYHVQNPLKQANTEDGFIGSSSSRTVPCKFERISSIIQKESQAVCDPTLRIRSSLNFSINRFSQGTRDLLITEETNVDPREETQIMRESRALTEFSGKNTGKPNSFFRLFGDEEEEEENFPKLKPFEVPTTESSTETDTMNIDGLKENPFSGFKSFAPNKNPELPKLRAQPSGAISLDIPEPSTSRTQSLDLELMPPPCNEICKSKFNPSESDRSNRWIKRLKLNESSKQGFIGTPSSNLDESLPHKKTSKVFEIMEGGSICSASTKSEVKDEEINLSNPWITRWRPRQHDTPPGQQQKAEPVVVCDPQNLNSEDFQKKQFPSTAAMALMGKSLSGFQTCEVRKQGSFVVWSSKSFS